MSNQQAGDLVAMIVFLAIGIPGLAVIIYQLFVEVRALWRWSTQSFHDEESDL